MTYRVIHHGDSEFKPEMFRPIKNRPHFNKPTGGLWTSPVGSDYGWKDWCDSNHFSNRDNSKSFVLELIEPKVFLINSPVVGGDYWIKTDMPIPFMKCLDYEKIVDEGYDIIHLTYNALYSQDYVMSPFYGWDVETVLILNPNIVYNGKEISYAREIR